MSGFDRGRMRTWRARAGSLMFVGLLAGCAGNKPATPVTLGTVQKGLHVGMAQAEVLELLGPPSIVSSDSQKREVWSYDKVSKESDSHWYLFWQGSESSQRTMTVLVTFEAQGLESSGRPDWRVAEYKYHATQF
jgi:outer membrane protein assembly factor BamE (lipoprotein component of BamABCDE complex)